jgi:hypothetical protein
MRAMAAWLVAAQEPGSAERAAAETEAVYAWRPAAGGGRKRRRRLRAQPAEDADGSGGSSSGSESGSSSGDGDSPGGRWECVASAAEPDAAADDAEAEPDAAAAAAVDGARVPAAVNS